MVTGTTGGVQAAGVIVGSQVVIAGSGVGEQMPHDSEDGAGDRDESFQLAPSFHQAPVTGAEEGRGLGGSRRRFSEDAFEVGVAVAGLAGPGPSSTPPTSSAASPS